MNLIKMLASRTARILAVSGLASAAAGAAVLIAIQASGGVGLPFSTAPAAASTSTLSTTGRGQWCTAFLDHLAADLKVPPATLEKELQAAGTQTVQDAVGKGLLTQAQATRIESRLGSKAACASLVARLGSARRDMRGLRRELIQAAATALKLTPAGLVADLKQGQSLSQIAAAHGFATEAAFRSALIAAATPDLDAAVKSGRLTSAQEKAFLDRLKSAPIPFWSQGMRRQAGTGPPGTGPGAAAA